LGKLLKALLTLFCVALVWVGGLFLVIGLISIFMSPLFLMGYIGGSELTQKGILAAIFFLFPLLPLGVGMIIIGLKLGERTTSGG